MVMLFIETSLPSIFDVQTSVFMNKIMVLLIC